MYTHSGALYATVLRLILLLALLAGCNPEEIAVELIGPSEVTMEEVYEEQPEGPSFDHSTFSEVLHEYVDSDGWVDYSALAKNPEQLDQYIESLGNAPFESLGRNEKLALLINAYNACTLRLILDYWPVKSIQDIPADKRWKDARWKIGENTWSLDQIEHKQIRPKFEEPRIHFAVNCAAISCPILRNEAYVADRIDDQLEEQTVYSHQNPRWFSFSKENNEVKLTKIYMWYEEDFEQTADTKLKYAARYSESLEEAMKEGEPEVEWLSYDWTLNDVSNKPKSSGTQ